jgi:hypothetical protein
LNYIKKILGKIKEHKISRIHGTSLLIDLFQNTEDFSIRIRCLGALDPIISKTRKSFDFLENLLISDENAKIRTQAAELMIKYFPNWSLNSFEWVIENETSPLVLQNLFGIIESKIVPENSRFQLYMKSWFEHFANNLGIDPKESSFILALEALFEKQGDISYPIGNKTYEFYDFLQTLRSPDYWLFVKQSHIIELRFNYVKWKYFKDYSGLKKELTKYNNLDMLLTILLKKRLNDTNSFQLPNSLHTLIYLTKLDLAQNNLISLPSSLHALKSLEYLNLSYNNLKNIPHVIFSLPNLKYLDISYNEIQKVPSLIQSLHKLRVLKIKGNKIKDLPEYVHKFIPKRN